MLRKKYINYKYNNMGSMVTHLALYWNMKTVSNKFYPEITNKKKELAKQLEEKNTKFIKKEKNTNSKNKKDFD